MTPGVLHPQATRQRLSRGVGLCVVCRMKIRSVTSLVLDRPKHMCSIPFIHKGANELNKRALVAATLLVLLVL